MTKIMVIRHAEKPNGEPGIMEDGTPNNEALTATGWKRANALATLFVPPNGRVANAALARPASLFATKVSAASMSLRPQQTVTPLKLAIALDFGLGEEAGLVEAAKKVDGAVLIAWHHEAIPDIANSIRGDANGVPQRWPGHRFDLVWVFDRLDDGKWSFAQIPQLLLPGDSPAPIGLNK